MEIVRETDDRGRGSNLGGIEIYDCNLRGVKLRKIILIYARVPDLKVPRCQHHHPDSGPFYLVFYLTTQ